MILRLKFLGAAGTVTGSGYLLEPGPRSITATSEQAHQSASSYAGG